MQEKNADKLSLSDQISSIVKEHGVTPLRILVDHGPLNYPPSNMFNRTYINIQGEIQENDHAEAVVVKILHPDKSTIEGYKNRLRKTFILGETLAGIPENDRPRGLSNVIGIPEVLQFHEPSQSSVERFVDTSPIGTNHLAEKGALTAQNLHDVVDYIRFIQRAGQQYVGNKNFLHFRISWPLVPEKATDGPYKGQYPDKMYHDFYENPKRMDRIRIQMGTFFIGKMDKLLTSEKTKALFAEGVRRYFALGNLIPGKMGKDRHGKMWILELERCCHTPQPATDYIALFTSLLPEPELQENYFRYAVEQNRDIPDFLEYKRLCFIGDRGVGELAFWLEEIEKPQDPEYKKTCEQAIDRLSELLWDAILERGIWEPTQYEKQT